MYSQAKKYFENRKEFLKSLTPKQKYPQFEANCTLREFNARFIKLGSGESKESEKVKLGGIIIYY